MKIIRFSALGLLSALLLSGCSQRLVDFTVISSKNVPITDEGGKFQKANSRVVGKDTKWSILFVPGVPDMKEAIDRAIEQYPGAVALTDGVIYSKGWSCLLFGQNKYVVEGTPLYLSKKSSSNADVNYQYNGSQEETIRNINFQSGTKQSSQPQSTLVRLTHVVEKGEKLTSIAEAYKVSVIDIMKWNELDSNSVSVGSKLTIYVTM